MSSWEKFFLMLKIFALGALFGSYYIHSDKSTDAASSQYSIIQIQDSQSVSRNVGLLNEDINHIEYIVVDTKDKCLYFYYKQTESDNTSDINCSVFRKDGKLIEKVSNIRIKKE